MPRAIRPDARPSYRTRGVIALGLSIWTLLQGITLIVAVASGGPTSDALAFFLTGVLMLYLAAASWLAWTWTGRARPRAYDLVDDEAEPHRHRGLAGEYEPPTRW